MGMSCIAAALADYIGEQCAVKWIHKRGNWCRGHWSRQTDTAAERYLNCIFSQKKVDRRILCFLKRKNFPGGISGHRVHNKVHSPLVKRRPMPIQQCTTTYLFKHFPSHQNMVRQTLPQRGILTAYSGKKKEIIEFKTSFKDTSKGVSLGAYLVEKNA